MTDSTKVSHTPGPYIVRRGQRQWAVVVWDAGYRCWRDYASNLPNRETAREYWRAIQEPKRVEGKP